MIYFGTYGGVPIVSDPDVPRGFIEFRRADGGITRLDLDPVRRRLALHAAVLMAGTWWGLGWRWFDDAVYQWQYPNTLGPLTWVSTWNLDR